MKKLITQSIILISLMASSSVYAKTQIQFWHAMEGELGDEVAKLSKEFNATQTDYEIIPVFKGTYEENMATSIAAFRAKKGPTITQVFEVGTATMMAAKGAIFPVHELSSKFNIPIDAKDYLPAVAGYYSDSQGRLISMPFNSSTPVLYFNKDLFKKAGLDLNPPQTWEDLQIAAAKLKEIGSCGLTAQYQSWTLLENFSAWHGLALTTQNNGFDGFDAKFMLNTPTHLHHLKFLQDMSKNGEFTYGGRGDNATSRFISGNCAMLISSSGSRAGIESEVKFKYGIGMMPYYASVAGAPQNSIIGGASLWVLAGKSDEEYKGTIHFFKFLGSAKVGAYWHQKTGYLPVTFAAYEQSKQDGFYEKNPGSDMAIKQITNKPPLSFTRGIRLGNFLQIRVVVDEAFEKLWSNKATPADVIKEIETKSDALLRKFEKTVK
ncbi:sn-glycerol-3-phosphate ABC transporter periplasmic binding protein [Gammaproteobacteria bacterium]|nr:sn-glycerol-3-phosphate ABC transporter periplasmic binding protein [Gammaproteobacteria bacterium]